MTDGRSIRFTVILILLLVGVFWAAASAQQGEDRGLPNGRYLATATWLAEHRNDDNLVILDVRDDEHFDGRLIPGAIRLPWSLFREDQAALGIGNRFVGATRAQQLLGEHGISRIHSVVLYDSVERDGGATSSYVFWVLDLLGHEEMRVLERGIDAWAEAGGKLAAQPREPEPVLYQAPADEIRPELEVTGDFIYSRLGDPYYQILDVRSPGEYTGEMANEALHGGALKLGHIPTAYNVEYKQNWASRETKALKTAAELRALYRGLEPTRTVVTYCHSARRSSFTYFVLRLLGYEDVRLYEASWFEWGNPRFFFPVETVENSLSAAGGPGAVRGDVRQSRSGTSAPAQQGGSGKTSGGYVSCGG